MDKLLFCLMGPTASGKTALACELVKQFPFEIVSVDSAMVYRGMDIGTAKPDAATLAYAPHHLLDIIDPIESYSAALFCKHAKICCEDILSRGKIPLLTGGTMMYFHALQQGLSSLPGADESIRQEINNEAQKKGWEKLHYDLKKVDPVTAAKIHPNDSQRIQRALEVYQLTMRPLSALISEAEINLPYRFVNLILMPEARQWLHERIALRFKQMLKQDFLAEVQQLIQHWSLDLHNPALRCVGYRQAYSYLQGEFDYPGFEAKGIAATRQLAKRQLTWLRHWQQGQYFAANHSDVLSEMIVLIQKILDNRAD